MKKISKILIALLLVIVAVFGVAGCNADTQSKIDELQSRIEDLQSQNAEMQSQIEELEQELERKNDLLRENAKAGLYSLQTAYDMGLLTREDLKAIAAESINHSLTLPELAIQQAIKKDYLNLLKESSQKYSDATLEDFDIWRYYGDYNGSIVVQISQPYTEYPGMIMQCIIKDVVIKYSGPNLIVWKN